MNEIKPIIDENIKYDLDYIKKNIDLNEFIKKLKSDLLWFGQSELSVINYKNNYNNKPDALEQFLVLNLYNCETEHFGKKDPLSSETIKIPKTFLETSKNFYKEIEILVNCGDLLERISSKFKKIMHREYVGEQGKNVVDSHSFYQLTINQSTEYFYLTKTGDYNLVVKFCDKLNEKEFINEIVQFKSARGYNGKENLIINNLNK